MEVFVHIHGNAMRKTKFIFWSILTLLCLVACIGKSTTNEKSVKSDLVYKNEIFLLPEFKNREMTHNSRKRFFKIPKKQRVKDQQKMNIKSF